MPSFHLATKFLDLPCGTGPTHGVNPEMKERLRAADAAVRAAFDALPPERRIDAATGRAGSTFSQWVGVSAPHVCWRPNAAQHSAGAALDIDPAANPYIVTRNGDVPGGEPGGEHLLDLRRRALAAYDRAMRFATPSSGSAALHRRAPDESTPSVWARFKAVSDALSRYLRFVVDPGPAVVSRAALENADDVSDEELLAAIPEGERLPLREAASRLDAHVDAPDFRAAHPGWSSDGRAVYVRILRDYELARIPMVIGAPSPAPAHTRNPARGFLQLQREIVTALCDQGLRWGACDFEINADGTSDNGAMMHFDLADAGGYPEVHSLLRFG